VVCVHWQRECTEGEARLGDTPPPHTHTHRIPQPRSDWAVFVIPMLSGFLSTALEQKMDGSFNSILYSTSR
jgi:hypothetical protein